MAKIIEKAEDLAGILRGLQSQGKVVVFTNGVFDLLHAGHIRALKDAKSRGDFLIVGVNTDESVKQFKDPSLPVNPLAERLEVLEALTMIDYLTTIPEPTADNVLKTLRPDLHAKGTDYTEETVPERETVRGYGGRIVIVGDEKTHSTTEIIRKIQEMAPGRAAGGAPPPAASKPAPISRVARSGGTAKSEDLRGRAREVYAGKAHVKVKVAPPRTKAAGARGAAQKPARKKVASRKR